MGRRSKSNVEPGRWQGGKQAGTRNPERWNRGVVKMNGACPGRGPSWVGIDYSGAHRVRILAMIRGVVIATVFLSTFAHLRFSPSEREAGSQMPRPSGNGVNSRTGRV